MTEPKPTQRIRVRKCGAKLIVPADTETMIQEGIVRRDNVTFVCAEDKGHEGPHKEVGSIQMDNVTARDFTITWVDAGRRSLRQSNVSSQFAASVAPR